MLGKLLELGKKIAVLRKYRYFTQMELAEKSGISRVYIGSLERGERNPTIGVLFAICNALDCEIDIKFNLERKEDLDI